MKKGTALNSTAIELPLVVPVFIAMGKNAAVSNRATQMRYRI